MATIDKTHGKIYFPPRFLPYLEKHRIFELFHECVEMLVQFKPRDHIKFLRDMMLFAAKKKDKQRIVFLTPASFDRETFSELVAQCLDIQNFKRMRLDVITRERLRKAVIIQKLDEVLDDDSCICPEEGGEDREFGQYIPWAEEPFFYLAEEIREEERRELELCTGETSEKEPCICVCPCKRLEADKEKDADADAVADVDEGSEESEDTSEKQDGEWVEEECPIPTHGVYRRKLSKGKEKATGNAAEAAEDNQGGVKTRESKTSIVDIDYKILEEPETVAKGWILEDFPVTGEEAEKLLALGIVPTHALRIIIDEEEEKFDTQYLNTVRDWKKAYKNIPVTEIKKGDRDIQTLAKDMCQLLSVMPHRHAPMQIRLVLIGSRGSGTTTQAEKLVKKYGLVHVDFEKVKACALQQNNELAKMYRIQQEARPEPELEAYFLEKALLTPLCRTCGWVLTGYPKNIDQMRMLDLIATPPNRVIFIELPPKECFVRLYYRKMDLCLGDEYKIPEIEPAGWNSFVTEFDPEVTERLYSSQRNERKQIIHDIEEYFLQKEKMMAYCGKTASCVDGDKRIDAVFQQIEQALINPSPAVLPRTPFAPDYKVEESHERLKKFRLIPGMFFNNMLLNPPEAVPKI